MTFFTLPLARISPVLDFYRSILGCTSIETVQRKYLNHKAASTSNSLPSPQKLELKRKKVAVNWIKKMFALECMLAFPWEWDSKGFVNLNEVGKGYSAFQEKDDLLPI